MPKLFDKTEIPSQLARVAGWELKDGEITKQYKFSDFMAAMVFVNHVADLAEKMDHHPDIVIQYNKVRLTLSTHSAGGLTDMDFTLARRIDA